MKRKRYPLVHFARILAGRGLGWAISLFFLFACSGEQQYSTQYACSFVFFASSHQTSCLTLALGNPGQFVIVAPQTRQGVTHLMLTPNNGEPEDLPMTTAKENDRVSYQNMGAQQRLVIGRSQFDGLKAYDGQCPNCMVEYGRTNFPLTWVDNGHRLKCDKCSRKYDPNADGIPTDGQREGDVRLLQYRADYNGERLFVHN